MAADSDGRWQRSVTAIAGCSVAAVAAEPTGSVVVAVVVAAVAAVVAVKLSSADWLIAAWPNCSGHYYYLHWNCVGRCVHHPDYRRASPARPGNRPNP